MSVQSPSRSESANRQNITTSTTFLHPEFKTVRDLREEVILLFYNSMLDLVVREWSHLDEDDNVTELPQGENPEDVEKVKDFKDLTNADLESHEVSSVKGSKVSLSRRSSRKSSSGLLSRSKHSRRSRSFTRRMSRSRMKQPTLDEQTSFSLEFSDNSTSFDWLVDTSPENVKIIFKNGNVYRGPVERKRFHGYGSFIWSDGTVYEGDFYEGHITGKGKLYYKDCSYYRGSFCKGLLHGEGCMYITLTNTLYSGEWKAGKKNGTGWLFYGPNNWYEGEWLNDLRHGKGTRQYDKTSMYQGDWCNGIRQGHGTMVWSNHDYYYGEWKNGTMDGYGEYIWNAFFIKAFAYSIMNKFEGNWVEGCRTGEGVLNFGFYGGARMTGYWVRNMKHGPAVVICGNGKTMTGRPLFLYDKPVELDIWYGSSRYNSIISMMASSRRLSFEKSMDRITTGSESHENVSLSEFPKFTSSHINPLCIPVHYEPNQVDLSYYLELFNKKHNLAEKAGNNLLELDGNEILEIEETKLRNVIISNNLPLKHIYYHYAFIATEETPKFRPVMIRLFLWQLYFDMNISTRGMSLIDTDLCLTENPNCGLETLHDPFERIYFWQFLQSLVAVSWRLYADAFELDTIEGTLSKILRKFIYDDLLPNVGKTEGTALCEYKNLLPIQSVYLLYRSIGDPPTARNLYKNFIKRNSLFCSDKIFETGEIKYLKPGSNVTAIGTTIIFLPNDEKIGTAPQAQTPYPFKHDNNVVLRNLRTFTKMKRTKLIDCIAEICPPVVNDGLIVNMDYPISFLEFYNIILSITYTKINDILNREKLKEQKVTQDQVASESSAKPSKKNIQKEKKDKKK